jgi:hypothetical protein
MKSGDTRMLQLLTRIKSTVFKPVDTLILKIAGSNIQVTLQDANLKKGIEVTITAVGTPNSIVHLITTSDIYIGENDQKYIDAEECRETIRISSHDVPEFVI